MFEPNTILLTTIMILSLTYLLYQLIRSYNDRQTNTISSDDENDCQSVALLTSQPVILLYFYKFINF